MLYEIQTRVKISTFLNKIFYNFIVDFTCKMQMFYSLRAVVCKLCQLQSMRSIMKNLFMLGTCYIWTQSDEWLVYKEFQEIFSTKTKPTFAYEHIRIYYFINVVNLLHVLVHVLAIFREVL